MQAKVRKGREGLVGFEVGQDAFESHVFHVWERYATAPGMEKMMDEPVVHSFLEALSPHLDKPVGLALFEMRDGKVGPAAVGFGPKGEGGLDDATGAAKFGGGASYKQTTNIGTLGAMEHGESLLDADFGLDSLKAQKGERSGSPRAR